MLLLGMFRRRNAGAAPDGNGGRAPGEPGNEGHVLGSPQQQAQQAQGGSSWLYLSPGDAGDDLPSGPGSSVLLDTLSQPRRCVRINARGEVRELQVRVCVHAFFHLCGVDGGSQTKHCTNK